MRQTWPRFLHGDWPDYGYVPQLDHYWEMNNGYLDTPGPGKTACNLTASGAGLSFQSDWAGRANRAVQFDAADYLYSAAGNADIGDLGSTFTFCVEFKMGSSLPAAAMGIASCTDNVTGWKLKTNTTGSTSFYTYVGGTGANSLVGTLVPNAVYQVVVTLVGGVFTIYVNGAVVSSTPNWTAPAANNNQQFLLGSGYGYSPMPSGYQIFRAGILKGKACSAGQVQNLYNTWVDCSSNIRKQHCGAPVTMDFGQELNTWLAAGVENRTFLVEATAVKLSDASQTTLLLSTAPYNPPAPGQYLPCIASIPSVDRKASSDLDPVFLPSYGTITALIRPTDKPDPANSIAWNLLLYRDSYTFRGQPLLIKLGCASMDYHDFQPVLTGCTDNLTWQDYEVEFSIYDRSRDLDLQVPIFELPESPYVDASSWGQSVPLCWGKVKFFKPLYVGPRGNAMIFALSGGVVKSLDGFYGNGNQLSGNLYSFIQKDISPVSRLTDQGVVQPIAFGPYSGSAGQRRWTIQCDSVANGQAVGQATFRWSVDGGLTWVAQGVATVNCAYSPGSLTKTGTGTATMTVSGTYNDPGKMRSYKVKCTRAGTVGVVTYPQIQWSDDGGATWSSSVNLANGNPISLSHGLSVSFPIGTQVAVNVDSSGLLDVSPMTHCHLRATGNTAGYDVRFRVNGNGNYGDQFQYGTLQIAVDWTTDGGSTYTAGALPNWPNGETEFDPIGDLKLFIGDLYQWVSEGDVWHVTTYTMSTTPTLVLNDQWTFNTNLQNPIPLADGVTIQFYSMEGLDYTDPPYGHDFYLWDQFEFIVMSTVLVYPGLSGNNTLAADVSGLLAPDGSYTERPAAIIKQMIQAAVSTWTDACFDTASLTAFDAAFPYQVGLFTDKATAIKDLITEVLAGLPSLYSVKPSGQFFLKELTVPSGSPVLALTDDESQSFPKGGTVQANPYKRVMLRFDHNHAPYQNPMTGSWPRNQWIITEWRQQSEADEKIRDTYPWAVDLGPIETCLVQRADVSDACSRCFTLFKVPRDTWEVDCGAKAALLSIGDVVLVTRSAVGLDAGALFLVIGQSYDLTGNKYTLTLWR